jgi:hypothetical protein
MRKKIVKPSAKSHDTLRMYAVFNRQNQLMRKVEMTPRQLVEYLNRRAGAGKSYYAVELKGLRRKLTAAERQPLEERIRNGSGLTTDDIAALKGLLRVLKTRPAREGMIRAFHFDTFLREEIPVPIWKAMGGELQ